MLCQTAIAVGQTRGATAMADFTRLTLGLALFHLGRWSDILPHVEYLLDTYGPSSRMGLGWRAINAVHTKHPDGYSLSGEWAEVARRIQDHQALVPALAARIDALRQRDEVEDALELVREFEKVTEDRPSFRIPWLTLIARVLAGVGEVEWLERLIVGFGATGTRADDPSIFQGLLARSRGNAGAAIKHLDVAVGLEEVSGSPWRKAHALTERAAAHLDRGNAEAATADLDEASTLLEIVGSSVLDDFVAEQRARL